MVLLLGYKRLKRPFHSKQTNCMPFFLLIAPTMNHFPPRPSTMFPPPLLQRRLHADVIRNWRALLTVRLRVLAAELLNSRATSLIMCFPPLTRGVALHTPNTLPTNEALGVLRLISLCFTSAIQSGAAALIGLLAFPCNSDFIFC